MASYDEMSPTNRRNLIEGLASLSGLQEGPKNALPDGTRYEYDPVLKRTVEVTPSGERFPVILAEGKLTRDSEMQVNFFETTEDLLLLQETPGRTGELQEAPVSDI